MKYLSYGNSLESDFNTSETEMLKPSDSISARDLNRPILNLYENSEDMYNILQSSIKSIYGNKNGIVPDVYECFNPSNIKIGSFMNETKKYIRVPTGLICLNIPVENSVGNPFSSQDDDAYKDDMNKSLFTNDKFHSYFIFNRPNTNLFERELANVINLDITDLNNDIKIYDEILNDGSIGYRMEVYRETTGSLESSYYPNLKENTKWNIQLPVRTDSGNYYITVKNGDSTVETFSFTPSGDATHVNELAVSAINLNSSKFTAESASFMFPYYYYSSSSVAGKTNYFLNKATPADDNIYIKQNNAYVKASGTSFDDSTTYYELINGEYIEHSPESINNTNADSNHSSSSYDHGFCLKCVSDDSDTTNNYSIYIKYGTSYETSVSVSDSIYERILNSPQKYFTNVFDLSTSFLTIYKDSLIKNSGFGEMFGLEPIIDITSILPSSSGTTNNYTIYYNTYLTDSNKTVDISKRFGIVDGTTVPDGCVAIINFDISRSGVSYAISNAKFSNSLCLYDKRTLYSKRAELNTLKSDTRTDLINYLYFKDSSSSPNREIEIKKEFVEYSGDFISGTEYYEYDSKNNEYVVTSDSSRDSSKKYYTIDSVADNEQIKITSPILLLRDYNESSNASNQYIKINKSAKTIDIVSNRKNASINAYVDIGSISRNVSTGNIVDNISTGNYSALISTSGNVSFETKSGNINLVSSDEKSSSSKINGVNITGHTVISSKTDKEILEIKKTGTRTDESILFTDYGRIGFDISDSICNLYADFMSGSPIISIYQKKATSTDNQYAEMHFDQKPYANDVLIIGKTNRYKEINVTTVNTNNIALDKGNNADLVNQGAINLNNSNIYNINSLYIKSTGSTNKNTINFCHSEEFLNTIQSYYTDGTNTPAGFYFYEGRNYSKSIVKDSVNLLLDLNNTCATFSSHLYISNRNETGVERKTLPVSTISITDESLHVEGDSVFNGYVSFKYPIVSDTTFNGSVTILGNGNSGDSLTITKGNAHLNSGSVVLDSGSITLASGSITLTSGNMSLSSESGSIVFLHGTSITWNKMTMPSGTIELGSGTVSCGSISCTGNISSGSFNNFKLSGTSITTANGTVLNINSSMTLSEASSITNVGNLHIMNGTYYSLSSINGRSILSSYGASAEYYAPTTSPRSYNGNRNFLTAIDGSFGYSQDSLYIDGSGYVHGTRIYNAVWNDFADFTTVPNDTIVEYGKAYILDKNGYHVSNKKAQKGFIGIASDTYGQCAGFVDGKKQIPIAVGGFVLAYTDKIYETGTELVAAKDGRLTKASAIDSIFHRSRIVGIFYKKETKDFFNKTVKVNGRNWVKVY